MSLPTYVLVTGINGFVGRQIGAELLQQGVRVLGVGRQPQAPFTHPLFQYETCDLLNSSQLQTLVEAHDLDAVLHLASRNQVAASWADPSSIILENFSSTLHLLEAIRTKSNATWKKILLIGSAHEAAKVTQLPWNPYGWSKKFQSELAILYNQLFELPVLVARTWNLIGSGSQGVLAEFVSHVVEIENGVRDPQLLLGTPALERDFLDVRDAITAYLLLLQHELPLPSVTWEVCSGTQVSLLTVANTLQECAHAPFHIRQNPSFVALPEPPFPNGNPQPLQDLLGWRVTHTLKQTLDEMLTTERLRQKEDLP